MKNEIDFDFKKLLQTKYIELGDGFNLDRKKLRERRILRTASSILTRCTDFTVELKNRDVHLGFERIWGSENRKGIGREIVRGEPIDRSVNMDDTFDEWADQVSTFPTEETTLFCLFLPFSSPLSSSLFLVFLSFGICRIIPGIIAEG